MSDDFEFWIIIPISGITIVVTIGMIIGGVSVGVEAVSEFLARNLSTILLIMSIIAAIISIVPTIYSRFPVFLVSGAILTSQLIFFIYKGYQTILAADGILWLIITFIFWIIYGMLNVVITYLGLGIACFFSFVATKTDNKKRILYKESMGDLSIICAIEGGVGAIGWILNLIFMALV